MNVSRLPSCVYFFQASGIARRGRCELETGPEPKSRLWSMQNTLKKCACSMFLDRWQKEAAAQMASAEMPNVVTVDQPLLRIAAQTHDSATVLTLDEYMEQQHRNIGVFPALVLAELALDLPDAVFDHPVINNLRDCLVQMVILDNAIGDDLNNILTIAMQELNLDLQAAIVWACTRHTELQLFLEQLNHMPVFRADIDMQLREYIRGIANWTRGDITAGSLRVDDISGTRD
ncbi:hypothetical protein C8J57DRAFT_1479879 [Mycena rebaudengoi]|nr:hypothetical protein C8J57DRAFT_1479879 [Mycena rebaudengoi]